MIHLASSDELLWQASGLLGFVPAEPPTIVRTSVELSNSQRDHCHDSGATPTACLTFIVVNPAHVKQKLRSRQLILSINHVVRHVIGPSTLRPILRRIVLSYSLLPNRPVDSATPISLAQYPLFLARCPSPRPEAFCRYVDRSTGPTSNLLTCSSGTT